jgi:hypothetical protein
MGVGSGYGVGVGVGLGDEVAESINVESGESVCSGEEDGDGEGVD